MNFIEELKWRGLLHDNTAGLEDAFEHGTMTGYIGYDPTAPSLTIGNLVTIMLLKHLQLHGHNPIVVMGGATGKIGDPSGKDQERKLLTYDTLNENIARQTEQFKKFLDFDGPNKTVLLNNEDFYKDMDVFTFLRDIGKNITVNYMMSKDSVKNRLEKGLSFTEFSYQLIQGYDFQYLYQKYNCSLQMGGSDQWGNITSGTHFVSKAGGKAHGLTCPLLTKSDGKKFGKSEAGNVWLDPTMTSPYKFYQFWLSTGVNDADLPKLFKVFSLRKPAELEDLLAAHAENPIELRQILAEELTCMVHSRAAFENAKKTTQIVFSKKLQKSYLEELSNEAFEMISTELPSFKISKAALEGGIALDELLAGQHDSLKSKSDIRRAVKGTALSLNTEKVTNHAAQIDASSLLLGKYIFFQNGRKNKFIAIAE